MQEILVFPEYQKFDFGYREELPDEIPEQCLMDVLEQSVFDLLYYPRPKLSADNQISADDRKDIIGVFEALQKTLAEEHSDRFLIKVVRYELRRFLLLERFTKDNPRFHSRYLLYMFLFIYDANRKLKNKREWQKFFKRYL